MSATSLSSSATACQSFSASVDSMRILRIFISSGIRYFHTLSFSVSRNPFVCHSCENGRVYTNNSQSGNPHTPFANQTSNLRVLTSIFSYPCELFCTRQKLNSLVFKRFRTLCTKHPGVGGGGTLSTSRFSSRNSRCRRRNPSSVSVNSALSAASALIPAPVFAGDCPLPATRSFPCYPDSCEPS